MMKTLEKRMEKEMRMAMTMNEKNNMLKRKDGWATH